MDLPLQEFTPHFINIGEEPVEISVLKRNQKIIKKISE